MKKLLLVAGLSVNLGAFALPVIAHADPGKTPAIAKKHKAAEGAPAEGAPAGAAKEHKGKKHKKGAEEAAPAPAK